MFKAPAYLTSLLINTTKPMLNKTIFQNINMKISHFNSVSALTAERLLYSKKGISSNRRLAFDIKELNDHDSFTTR
jgi:hypothetical protein